jgi:predicted Zn-dependent peptidase
LIFESTKENLKSALALVREVLREPSFNSNEFEKLKQTLRFFKTQVPNQDRPPDI